MKTHSKLVLIGLAVVVAVLAVVFAGRASRRSVERRFPDAQWVYIGTQGAAKSDGTRFYVDKSSIIASGSSRTFWLRLERAQTADFPFKLWMRRVELDCTSHTVTFLEGMESDEYGNYSDDGEDPSSAASILPQTNIRAAEPVVCHRD